MPVDDAGDAYWDGAGGGSRARGGGPPSIDDMDIPVLPVRGSELSAGSSRLEGNTDDGPTETDGGRGAGAGSA